MNSSIFELSSEMFFSVLSVNDMLRIRGGDDPLPVDQYPDKDKNPDIPPDPIKK
ncbi:MAG: hypothetical protein NTW49_01125 [Bacteroidia bacterium]|nr:hypothetical protein [Bacteroidia bacterium]